MRSPECSGCGSTRSDRKEKVANDDEGDTDIMECPHCGGDKCSRRAAGKQCY